MGGCIDLIASVLAGIGLIPSTPRMCPRYCISLAKKWHLLNFIHNRAWHSFLNTVLMCCRCSSGVELYMMMSSKYAIAKGRSFKTPVISSWKYAGACANPKATLMYSYFPNGDVNAVLGTESSANQIWWYLAHKSNVEKYLAPFSCEKMSSTFGIGHTNFLVTLLSAL